MLLKDYYSILQLEPSATQLEIKKAYRKLALQYHPDITHNEPYAAAQFSDIKEAYEVLTDPAKKEYYLQQRWYNQSIGKRKKQEAITPVNVLKQTIELEKYISTLDVFRMDKLGLYEYINELIPDNTIQLLNNFNDLTINKEIIFNLLKAGKLLPLNLAQQLSTQLKKINVDASVTESIETYLQQHKKNDQLEKNKIWLIMLIVAILILLIYFAS